MWSRPRKIRKLALAIAVKSSADKVFLLSSSIAYNCFLSFIPIIFVVAGIYLILNFSLSWDHLELTKDILPKGVYGLFERQADRVSKNMGALNIATMVAFVISLWLSNNLTRALAQSLNVVYGNKSRKRVIYTLGESIVHTLVIILSFIVLIGGLGFVPMAFSKIEIFSENKTIFWVVQWSLIFTYVVVGLSSAYKFLPTHDFKRSWLQCLPGAVVATIFGLSLAFLFSLYAQTVGGITRIYGALAGIVVFMIWLRLTFSCVLLGGEVNYYLNKYPRLLNSLFLKTNKN